MKIIPRSRISRLYPLSRAFTLVELLVVLAVMAILAALILSAVTRARAAAGKSSCLSNVHQINAALLMYADDHADAVRNFAADNYIYFTYKDAILPYLTRNAGNTNNQLFTCPADDFDCDLPVIRDFFNPRPVTGKGFYRLKASHFSSYIFNGAAGKSEDTRLADKPFSSLAEPSRLALVLELSGALGLSGHDRRHPLQFNNAKNVVSFVDGHVSFIPIYWNGVPGDANLPITYNPPSGYDYLWFPK